MTEIAVGDGCSGKSLGRPGLTRLLELIRRRAANVVIVAKLDRIARTANAPPVGSWRSLVE